MSAIGPTGKPERLTAVQHEAKFLALDLPGNGSGCPGKLAHFPSRHPVERFGALGAGLWDAKGCSGPRTWE